MWVNRQFFEMVIADNKTQADAVIYERLGSSRMSASTNELRAQKAKDDVTIDWMRHRINALEKQNAILLQKAAGIFMPVPEIVPSLAGQMQVPDFDSLPSFEDVGDNMATRYGIAHTEDGVLEYTK